MENSKRILDSEHAMWCAEQNLFRNRCKRFFISIGDSISNKLRKIFNKSELPF